MTTPENDRAAESLALATYALTRAEEFEVFATRDVTQALQTMMATYCASRVTELRRKIEAYLDAAADGYFDGAPVFGADKTLFVDGLIREEQGNLNVLLRQLTLWHEDLGVHSIFHIAETLRSHLDASSTPDEKRAALSQLYPGRAT